MDLLNIRHWAGTEASLHEYQALVEHLMAGGMTLRDSQDDDKPELLSVQGDIGVVSVRGKPVSQSNWLTRMMGATAYTDIREALLHAAQDASVSAIVMDIASPGGHVAGVADVVDLVASIDKKIKPVYTYSDGPLDSAAYWIGSAARGVYLGRTAEAGSIGVLFVHMETSKADAQEGITKTVLRSGKYKAMGNPHEPLSSTAKDVLQAEVDKLASVFTEDVARGLGVSPQEVDRRMGQGRTFLGQDAVDAGLAKEVITFDALMSRIQGGIDSQKSTSQYGLNYPKGPKLKTALTEQQIAAMAAGATALAESQEASASAEQLTAEQAAAVEPQAGAPAATEAAATPANDTAPAVQPGVVELLQAQLAAAQAQVVDLRVELATAKASLDAAKDGADKMVPVVRGAVSNLRVALGGSAAGVDAMDSQALLAEHASLSAQFTTKFKAGGVAAVSQSANAEKSVVEMDPVRRARLNATRPAPTK